MGANDIWKLGYRKAWAFIGIKGMKKKGVDNTGNTANTGMILGFTKVVKKTKKVNKVQGGSKIQAVSSGYLDGNNARIIVNDKDLLAKAGRGINVVALAGQNHDVIA